MLNFMHFPIKTGAPKSEVQILADGVLLYQFSMELCNENPDFYCFLDLSEFADKKIEVVAPCLDGIFIGKPPEEEYKGLYEETLRPQFHFSSRRGWLNDPNGLVYHNGLFHMYYQHNPFGVLHGDVNVSWGHAVSADLLHWQEKKDAILPWRRDWFIASGTAIVNNHNMIIASFTALGARDENGKICPSGGQFMAESTDGGETFSRFSDTASIGVPNGADWRDPCLFEVDGTYYSAVYERRDDVNGVAFYSSKNLHDWDYKSWVADLYECPDLFPFDVAGEEKWVLFGADGMARLGEFCDGTFIDDGIRFPLDYGTATYAGQTWRNAPDGKRYHISWVRGMDGKLDWHNDMGYPGMPFSQCMSIPCEITLHKVDDTYHLCRFPVQQLESLRIEKARERVIVLNNNPVAVPLAAPTEMCLSVQNFMQPQLMLNVLGYSMVLDLDQNIVTIDDKPLRKLLTKKTNIRILTDRTTVEIFIGNEVSATYAADTRGIELILCGSAEVVVQEWDLKPTLQIQSLL